MGLVVFTIKHPLVDIGPFKTPANLESEHLD